MNANSGTMSHEHDGDMEMSGTNEEEMPFEALTTGGQESCSHCLMHPQSDVNLPSAQVLLNESTSHDILPASSLIVWAPAASRLPVVDVHDHGPPGVRGPRYVLISTFRI